MDPTGLKRGLVIRVHFDEIDNPKQKMGVVVAFDPSDLEVKFVLINSKITDFVRQRPGLRDRNIAIDPSDYPFLEHTSYINCAEIISKTLMKLTNRFESGEAKIRGELIPDHIDRVVAQIQKAATISGKNKKLVAAPFTPPMVLDPL